MSPQQIRSFRETFGLTQEELASCLGLTQKTISQYEMGFRKPGPTVKVILPTLEILPVGQAKKLLCIMTGVSEELRDKSKRRTR